MIRLLLFLALTFHPSSADNCSSAKSCSECMVADTDENSCYWCGSLVTDESRSGCLRFKTDEIANLLCPSQWVHIVDMCPAEYRTNNVASNVDQILNQLNLNQRYKSIESKSHPSRASLQGADLKDLLHKLLILKLLRKMKDKDTVLTEEEETLLYKLTHKRKVQKKLLPPVATTTTTSTTSTTTTATTTTTTASIERMSRTEQLSEILKLLQAEAERRLNSKNLDDADENIKNELELLVNKISKQNEEKRKTTNIPTPPPQGPSTTSSTSSLTPAIVSEEAKSMTESVGVAGVNHVEQVDVKYEDGGEETLSDIISHRKPSPTASPTTTRVALGTEYVEEVGTGSYNCKLLGEDSTCNSDHNCTWCNTLDSCIHRTKEDYKTCVRHAQKMVDEEYGLDRCFKSKGCKDCVEDDKCYWCETSQRCHTYPFFGYVPNSCGGDWYVKQCDVQLAVIIVVLPLIIILLGMVTFYFCLKYCHYRHKVLRVPLFDKPGIFDYRKDKKVYFVNPEDESSDDELAKEKMRKKYRLPVEKAPLIDPNT